MPVSESYFEEATGERELVSKCQLSVDWRSKWQQRREDMGFWVILVGIERLPKFMLIKGRVYMNE